MATYGLNTPPAFLTAPNTPVFDTEFYIDELKIYLASIGADKFTETRRVAIALNVIGPTCRRILKAASNSLTTLTEIFDLLLKLFPSSVSSTIAREKFNKRVQNDFESTMDFFASISSQAAKGDYGSLTDDLVRDKFILGSKPAIKEKLILEQPKTLDTALATALRIETVQSELAAKLGNEVCSVNFVQSKKSKSKPRDNRSRDTIRCFRCNKPGVKANHDNCKAIGQTCRKCGRKNHFASVCFHSRDDISTADTPELENKTSNVMYVYSNF